MTKPSDRPADDAAPDDQPLGRGMPPQMMGAAANREAQEAARLMAAEAGDILIGIGTADLIKKTRLFHQTLLANARASLAKGHADMALVIAQTAAEQCTEWALTSLLGLRGAGEIAEPIVDQFRRSVITSNKRLRDLYNKLARDKIQQTEFWVALDQHRVRRNDLVHKGIQCTHEQAQESVDVVGEYVNHVEGVIASLQAASK